MNINILFKNKNVSSNKNSVRLSYIYRISIYHQVVIFTIKFSLNSKSKLHPQFGPKPLPNHYFIFNAMSIYVPYVRIYSIHIIYTFSYGWTISVSQNTYNQHPKRRSYRLKRSFQETCWELSKLWIISKLYQPMM